MRIYKNVEEVISDVEGYLGIPLRLDGEELKIDGLRYFINWIFGRKEKQNRWYQSIPQEKAYEWVYAENLTPEELSKSKLPDDSICSIHVSFKSLTGKSYFAAHNRYSETERRHETSQIRLCGPDKDKTDFRSVERILRRITGEITRESNVDDDWDSLKREWGDDIIRDVWSHIYLKGKLTQTRVASFVQAYALHFREVNIGRAAYTDVPISSVKDSRLPLEKLFIRDEWRKKLCLSE